MFLLPRKGTNQRRRRGLNNTTKDAESKYKKKNNNKNKKKQASRAKQVKSKMKTRSGEIKLVPGCAWRGEYLIPGVIFSGGAS